MRIVKHITADGGQGTPHDLMSSIPILLRLTKISNTLNFEPLRGRIMEACVIREVEA